MSIGSKVVQVTIISDVIARMENYQLGTSERGSVELTSQGKMDLFGLLVDLRT